MTVSLEWARPLDARTRRYAVDYASKSAEFALIRGETSIAVRIANQLVLAQPKIGSHRELLDRALAARTAAYETIAHGVGKKDAETINAVAAAYLAIGELSQAANLWLALARANPSEVDAFLSFAWCMARAGNHENAAQIANHVAAVARHPKIEAIRMMIALAESDVPKLLGHAQSALTFGSEAQVWLPMGAVFAMMGAVTESTVSLGLRLEDLSATLHLFDVAQAIQGGRDGEAIAAADEILKIIPDDRWAAMFKVIALLNSGDKVGAVKAQTALASALGARLDTLTRLVDLLYDLSAHQEVVDLGKVIRERLPSHYALLFSMAHSAGHIGDMDMVDDIVRSLPEVLSVVRRTPLSPFSVLSLFDDPEVQRESSIRRGRTMASPEEPCDVSLPDPPKDGLLRIGYLSNDFHNHATMKLITEMWQQTDRDRFETIAYSYDKNPDNPDRARAVAAVDRFVDVQDLSDGEIAQQVRRDGVHVLVDLKGYTGGSRLGVLRHRLAPIQVNWLGYPGTYGMAEVDYIVADRFIIPPGAEMHYTEQVVRLPECYQPNGRHRFVADIPTREQAGLPANGFVFASFNQLYKVNSTLFGAWMEILAGVPGSVLWLLAENDAIAGRLRKRAKSHGIDSDRLVFAPRAANHDHLARYGLVDLALDTYPVGSHTTASDALWVGAPLLALAGRSFVARVSGSILKTAGMGQLIATSFDEYKAKAIALGNDPGTAKALRDTLLRTRDQMPLFDPARFAAHMGKAFEMMVDIWRRGEKPRSFDVPLVQATTVLHMPRAADRSA
jgi:protein O-GlcNAc transferase